MAGVYSVRFWLQAGAVEGSLEDLRDLIFHYVGFKYATEFCPSC